MDREISKEVLRKERRKQLMKIGGTVGGLVLVVIVVTSLLQSSLEREELSFSKVDRGVIEVSVSASGKVVPAYSPPQTTDSEPGNAESSQLSPIVVRSEEIPL